ncbi:MAG: hypothetical protein MI807_10210 [Verrucomicrobiales bacterium]|nr:hypothetical protein [Verrucomicrobiales bacterium]
MKGSSTKRTAISIIAGATLLALVPVTLIIPAALELTSGNWFQLGLIFTATLCFLIVVGLSLIALPFASTRIARLRVALVLFLIGMAIAWFAGGRQLAEGPVETAGTIEVIEWSKKRDGLVVDPINKKVKSLRARKHDLVSVRADGGAVSTITLIRSDTNQLLALRDQHGKNAKLRIVTLRHFKRLLSVEEYP